LAPKYGTISTLGLREQKAHMNLLHPQFKCAIVARNGGKLLVCRGSLRPTPITGEYLVKIEYITRLKPKVWIESPPLQRRTPDERIPHTYADDRPCLFKEDFRSDMSIGHTIVPWLSLWLVFYESWRITGEWQGGGLHPTPEALEQASDVTE
jgi:hypothetical protein